MTGFVPLIIILIPLTYWFVSKSKNANKKVQFLLGVASIISVFLIFFFIALIASFAYNWRYNNSAKMLTESIIECIERGDTDLALKELKKFNETIAPTYMNRNFVENAKITSEILKTKKTVNKNAARDATHP